MRYINLIGEEKNMGRTVGEVQITQFFNYLQQEERSAATVEKYLRDVRAFAVFIQKQEVTKELVVAYKKKLQEDNYAVRSINSMLASINGLFQFLGWNDCRVKSLKCQREIYCSEEKELKKEEYLRLLEASKGKEKLNLILQTICGTGIRISELKYFTVEAVCRGEVIVNCKNKTRIILVPGKLRKILLKYVKKEKLTGCIFVTKTGKPMDRSNIWAKMKALCKEAKVNPSKVFPHNLRKLFARTFYGLEKDIAKLADILGHRCELRNQHN